MNISLKTYLLGCAAVTVPVVTVVAIAVASGNDGSSASSPVADAFYADQQAVCEALDASPTTSTVIAVIQDAADEGLNGDYMHDVLSGAITDICPQYINLVYPTGKVS